ncbi:Phthiodiolone/phenolphthiodiolone dimycocerosates ketoreductase [Mycobacteroides abscessus subsp. massiliense]|nr:Phthiodiolone/phenolphthiodiolone dimycocerosates ketoreductase [Mycobacteroides abscessus subsp. massiliense]
MSQGRFTLGLGAGWQENEHQRYGLELGKPGPRVDRFSEGLQVITGLLNEQATTVNGAYYQLAEAICEPKPLQRPLPILIGATQPRMLGLTARYAQEWNQWSTPGAFRDVSGRLDAAILRRFGVPPRPASSSPTARSPRHAPRKLLRHHRFRCCTAPQTASRSRWHRGHRRVLTR